MSQTVACDHFLNLINNRKIKIGFITIDMQCYLASILKTFKTISDDNKCGMIKFYLEVDCETLCNSDVSHP